MSFRPNQKDVELGNPPTDSVSKIAFSPSQDILAVACWNGEVRLYNVDAQGQNAPRAMYTHEAPVLDITWTKSGSHVISAGCDNEARMYNIATGETQQVAAHDAPIKCCQVVVVQGQEMLITASWDKRLRYWDMQSAEPKAEIPLSERAYAMDCQQSMLVVATADRKIHVINLTNPGTIFSTVESPLKWQTRVVSVFPKGDGIAIGSIEGRVGIHYPGRENESPSPNYSFKCHRYDVPQGSMPGSPAGSTSQQVFAVNCICFHQVNETFCTGGGDGSITFWDGKARTRLKSYTLKELSNGNQDTRPPEFGMPVVSASFNHDRQIMAYALSYDWSKGHGGMPNAQTTPPAKIFLHPVRGEDVDKKNKLGR